MNNAINGSSQLNKTTSNTEDKIRSFLKTVEQYFEDSKSGGLITIEKAEVIRYKSGR